MCQQNNTDRNIPVLTDGGLETDIIFNRGVDLPHFASFPLIDHPKHKSVIDDYYREYLDFAKEQNTDYVLETPTWRASPDWGYKLGYSVSEMFELNKRAVEQMQKLRTEYQDGISKITVSGNIGPRFDGYVFDQAMTVDEARIYNLVQVEAFRETGADVVTAATMTNVNEALGIVLASKEKGLDAVVSFTVELDGNLPSGESLKYAIEKIDSETDGYPLHYMINCAHPSHFADRLHGDDDWKLRIKGVRANASCKSHAELDEATELDPGDHDELADWYRVLAGHLPNLYIYGGCCGTDVSHVKKIYSAVTG